MRILLGVHQFLPDFFAGTEMLTFNTARELRRRGHEVRVFAGYATEGEALGPPYFDFYEYEGIPVYRYFYSREDPFISRNVIEASYNNPRSAQGFERFVTSFSPDVVHFYHLQRLSGSTIDVCRRKKIPMVFTATDFWVVCPLHQLYLPDGSHCLGPDVLPANCLKHLCLVSNSWILKRTISMVPCALLKIMMRLLYGINRLSGKPFDSIKALANRKDYLLHRLEYVDRIMVATQFMGDTLRKWGVNSSKIVYLPFAVVGAENESVPKQTNSVPFDGRAHFHEALVSQGEDCCMPIFEPGSEQQKNEGLQIGYIGTLLNYKGAHVLLSAIQKIPKELPVVVRIYGDVNQFPDYIEQLRMIAGSDTRIRFCGTFPPDGIGEILRALDILVIPSLWHENTPLVIHEALGAGVPVVGSDVSGVNELIRHGINGLLFERGDGEALAAIIQQLHENRQQLETLSKNCKPVVSMKEYVDRLEQIYAGVI